MVLILYTIMAYILIGGIGIAVANRRGKKQEKGPRWLKFVVYQLIVCILIFSIRWSFFQLVAILIILIGYYELLRTTQTKRSLWLPALLIYTIAGVLFIAFSFIPDKNFQLFVYFQVFTFDAFSQVTGQVFGKRLLVPRISPAKTVEGLIGGFLFCIVSSLIAAGWLGIGYGHALALALLSSVSAFAGDVLASAYKRKAGIKDYSNLLPGQGGFLDRFDSFIMTGGIYTLLYLVTHG